MTRHFRHAAVSLLFAAACGGRGELELSPFPDQGASGAGAVTAHAGATGVGKGGSSSRGGAPGSASGGSFGSGATFGTGGSFGTAGTFAVAGTFSSAGSLPVGGTFGTAGTFAIAGTSGMAGSENGQAGEPGVAGAGSAAPVAEQDVAQLATGLFHVCALGVLGDVKCWGAGDHGALGYGSTAALGDNEAPRSLPAVEVADDASEHVAQIVAGGYHTCVLFTSGTVKCWGENSDGQLGYGDVLQTRGSSIVPASFGTVEVSASATVTALSLCAGEKHTCALLSDGSVKCWGSNARGQLGYGNAARVGAKLAPADVAPVSLSNQLKATQLACGANHTCAVLSDGTVQCWGENADGQLGLGNVAIIGDDEKPDSVGSISLGLASGVMVKQIVAGHSHTCILTSDQTVRCWGVSTALGIGTTANVGDTEPPSSVSAVRLVGANETARPVRLSAGSFHTCALFDSGTTKCWGRSDFGELGQGDLLPVGIDNDPADVPMIPINTALDSGASAIFAGNFLSCLLLPGLHPLDHTSLYCWGWNEYGQLGHGDTVTIGDDEQPGSGGPVQAF
ncbi:MAG TPA: hypothetical protein VNG33_13840 [Polyangiaceae bacterium]|nr:hypothetical protein [Polyangiaceae bacterium]